MSSTKFLLADDHSLIRQGIEFLIEDLELNSEVVHASNLAQILEKIEEQKIDIAIIDAHFPDGNSLSILPKIKDLKPEIKILIFSGIDEKSQALKFINAGANGFLSKLNDEDVIADAILKIHQDGEYLSPMTQALLLDSLRNPNAANPLQRLTDRELEIAKLYAKGLGNLEIANELNIKQNTVSTIKKRIFDKLKIDNLVELIDLIKDNQ
ncbi:response regulator transcription factor [Chryseobacterium sp. POL2]|uniref:response regulator transcription factor n=1 Tax=Chryseobacterium sp. POL2 TaxID=2713414 RepID=UPI0013E19908|nr:response regulator transcription factor [Chryseobacterium sp. POL2]QIG89247.1 response regulator transcription factor [Chryseobacterium sp. POL2]